MSRPAYLFVPITLFGLLASFNPSNAGERSAKTSAPVPHLAENEMSQEFEYVFEGDRKKGMSQVLIVDIGNGKKMEFVRIRKETFTMGSPKEEWLRWDDEVQHEVEITKDFYLGKYVVTQAQYKAVIGKNPSQFKGERLPVDNVSWDDAAKYCEALSKKLKQKMLLPSEAQWEYACRAGTKTPFHFGSKLNGDLANCDGGHPYGTEEQGTYKEKTTEVGLYPANPWGLYDMHGNVWQWCQDYYGPYEKLNRNRDPVQLVRQTDHDRVLRGGSWFSAASNCRSAARDKEAPQFGGDFRGFRVCLSLDK